MTAWRRNGVRRRKSSLLSTGGYCGGETEAEEPSVEIGDSGFLKTREWGILASTRMNITLLWSFGTSCPERLWNVFKRFSGSDWTKSWQIHSKLRTCSEQEFGLNGLLRSFPAWLTLWFLCFCIKYHCWGKIKIIMYFKNRLFMATSSYKMLYLLRRKPEWEQIAS